MRILRITSDKLIAAEGELRWMTNNFMVSDITQRELRAVLYAAPFKCEGLVRTIESGVGYGVSRECTSTIHSGNQK